MAEHDFILRGQFFELPLPASWGPHPGQARFRDAGAVDVATRRELIVSTQAVNVGKAKADGLSFEAICRQFVESRRSTVAQFAAGPGLVEPVSSEILHEASILVFRARLSKAPYATTNLFFAGVGAPTGRVRRATTRERPLLSCSFYDHNGGELDSFVREVLPALKWRV